MTKLHLSDEGTTLVPSIPGLSSKTSLRQKLMFAASASMMSVAAPLTGLYGGRAFAQVLPSGCVDTNPNDPTNANTGNGVTDDDETITCISTPANTAIGSVPGFADSLTINIGDGTTGTIVQQNVGYSGAVNVGTSTEATINVEDNVIINGLTSYGILVYGGEFASSISINGDGSAEAPSNRIITGEKGGIEVDAVNAVVTVSNLNSVSGGSTDQEGAITIRTTSGDVSISDIDSAFSESGSAIIVTSIRGQVSIQNVSVPQVQTGVTSVYDPQTQMMVDVPVYDRSRYGISVIAGDIFAGAPINIGAEDPSNGTGIGDIFASSIGLNITAATNVEILTDGIIESGGIGILLNQASLNGSSDIAANGAIRAQNQGIEFLNNGGSGNSHIAVTDVRSDASHAIDIETGNSAGTIDLIINGDVSGYLSGIYIDHDGPGRSLLSLGATASIEGLTQAGVDITAFRNGTNLIVQGSSGTITGATCGAELQSNNGEITVSDLTSVAGGSADGIWARSQGGLVTLQNIDNVFSENAYAVNVDTRLTDGSGGGDISIQNITIAAFDHDDDPGTSNLYSPNGIVARHGTGTLNIGAADPATGSTIDTIDVTGRGIYAIAEGGDVEILLDGLIKSGNDAITVDHNGGGGTSVDVLDVTSLTGKAIFVTTVPTSTGVTVRSRGTLNAGEDGINVNHEGTGDVLIEAYQISDIGVSGIDANTASSAAGAMTIRTTGYVFGAYYGIFADHSGADALTIEADDIRSTDGYGIYAIHQGGSIDVTSTGTIYAAQNGFKVINYGATGAISLDTSIVQAGENGAISVENRSSDATEILINGIIYDLSSQANILTTTVAGAELSFGSRAFINTYGLGNAIEFQGYNGATPDDVFNMDEMAQIIGAILMGDGADTANLASDNFTTIYGGAGTDTVNLTATTARTFTDTVDPNNKIREFEILGFSGDNVTLAGTHTGWDGINFNLGTTTLEGVLDTPLVTINAGGTLHARDGTRITGDLANNGTLLIGDSPGIFTVAGDFFQSADGILPVEIFSSAWDQLEIEGSATLDGTLRILSDVNDLPNLNQFYPFITAQGGQTGQFATIEDNVPDLDFTVLNEFGTFFLEFVPEDPIPDPDPVPDPDPTPEPEPAPNPDPTPSPDPDPVQTPDPDPTPEPEPEPLLSAKEIVPSGLSAAMRVNDMFVENLIQRRAVQSAPDQWSFWTNGFGGQHDVGVDNGIPGWDGDTSGLALGVERLISVGGNPVLFGAAGGYTEASITSDASHGDVEGYHLGAFANADLGVLFVAGSLAYSWQDYGFERAIIGPSSATLAYGETEGTGWALKSEAFYDLLGDAETGTSFGPVATFGSTIAAYDGFKETGAGILNLNWSDESAYQTVLGLGGEGGIKADLNGLTLDTGLRVLYESVGGDRTLQTRAFLDVPGAQFKPRAASLDADRVAVSFDTKLYFTKSLFAHVRYDTTRGENLIDHEGWAGITLRF